jgi:hypothetical protein
MINSHFSPALVFNFFLQRQEFELSGEREGDVMTILDLRQISPPPGAFVSVRTGLMLRMSLNFYFGVLVHKV